MMKKYLIYSIVIVILGAISFSIIEQTSKHKVPGKLDRLPCHKNITSFERAYDTTLLNNTKTLLLNGNYQIKSYIDKAQFMKSTLFDFINLEETNKHLYEIIDTKAKKQRIYNKGATIEYTIFENDIEDPKKKSDKCKLYRGYVVLKVKNDKNKVLYQVQIDFMDYKGKDIYKTLDCALESFLTY